MVHIQLPSSINPYCLTTAIRNIASTAGAFSAGRELYCRTYVFILVDVLARYMLMDKRALKEKLFGAWGKVRKTANDDPRRVIHAVKVGLALTVVSIVYYANPLYDGFGVSALWAVITVVFVLEFSVGGTLYKGLNRTFATFTAGALGVGVHHVAVLLGHRAEPFFLGFVVFLFGAVMSFARFIPELKSRFDYGMIIAILTFSMVAVSSYRVEDALRFAHQRLSTVAVGCAACIAISFLVSPVWSGRDLHRLITSHLDKLATDLEGLASDYFHQEEEDVAEKVTLEGKAFLQAYKSVLNSKTTEENQANLARWEPRHGGFSFRHPWGQYLKVGALARRVACCMEAFNAHIVGKGENTTAIKGTNFREGKQLVSCCREMCLESATSLRELSSALKSMSTPSPCARAHITAAMAISNKLKNKILDLHPDSGATFKELNGMMQIVAVASLIVQMVRCMMEIVEAVEELVKLAGFHVQQRGSSKAVAMEPVQESSAHVVAPTDGQGQLMIVVDK